MAYDVKDAQELFEHAVNGWSEIYRDAKDDLDFYMGNQWPDQERRRRIGLKRPALVVNKLPQFVHQVTNDIRMNTPSIVPMPVDDGADIETAKILKGVIRHIEYSSGADEVYDTAAEYAVKCSVGFIRVDHRYVTEFGFDQELILKRVHNPLSVYLDPDSTECDGRDAMFAFQVDTMSERQFKKLYKGFDAVSFDMREKKSRDGDSITIAEMFKIEETAKQVALLADGSVVEYQDGFDGVQAVRSIKQRKVIRCKMSGADVLEETTFPGIYVPIVPVYGEEHWSNGKRHIFSLIRQAKDAQRRYNHWASKETEILSQAPIAPIMAAEGQTENWAKDWTDPENAVVLRYKTTDAMGNPIPAPQRLSPPQVPTGIINAMQGAVEDIKSSMGLYNASIGAQANEKSGVAIQARQREGDVATFHFGDNLTRSIAQVGRILINAIPEVYDTQRIIRIVGDEDEVKMVGINGAMAEDQPQHYDLTKAAQYDIRVTTGASFTTKRQETQAMMTQLLQGNPQLLQVMGDLMFKYSDMPGAEAISARLKKTIPPQLLESEDNKDSEAALMQAQAAIQQLTAKVEQDQQMLQQGAMAIDELKQQLAETEAKLNDKQVENVVKLEELNIKKADMKLKYMTALKPEQPQEEQPEQPIETEDDGIHVLQAKLQEKLDRQAQEEIEKQQMIQMQLEQMQREEHFKQIQLQQEEQERIEKKMQAEALMNSLNGIQAAIGGLIQEIQKPKTVVRDANGMIAGVQ